jgi:hypothetical protein
MKQPIEVSKLYDTGRCMEVAKELGGDIHCGTMSLPNEWVAEYQGEVIGNFPIADNPKLRCVTGCATDLEQIKIINDLRRQNIEIVHSLLFLVAQRAGHKVDSVNKLIYPKEEE